MKRLFRFLAVGATGLVLALPAQAQPKDIVDTAVAAGASRRWRSSSATPTSSA